MRVLILANDGRMTSFVEETLRQVWCETEICSEAAQGICALEQGDYDAAILGESLDGEDGIILLEQARRNGCQTPVLVLFPADSTGGTAGGRDRTEGLGAERRTPQEDSVQARVRALEGGADYCLNMPVDERELLAVIKAINRRGGVQLPERLTMGNLYLDQATFTLSGPGGTIQLGRREFDVMRLLMVNRDMIVSKEMLLARIWGGRPDAVDNNVEVYISFLRRKLESLQVNVSIVTKRRLGYKLMVS